MLDNQTPENQMQNDEPDLDAMAEIEIEDGEADEIEADDEPELTITIEGEEPEIDHDAEIDAELGDRGKRAIQAARKAQKETAARNRALEAELAEMRTAYAPKAVELVKPDLAELGYNQDLYDEKLLEYGEQLRAQRDKKAAQDAENKATLEAYDAKLAKYRTDRTALGVDDDLQSEVTSKLTQAQQSVIIDACADPAKVIAALAKNPKLLAEIAGLKEVHKFSYRLAQIEGKIIVTQKTPPPPETKLRGGSGSGSVVSFARQIEAAEKEAEITRDRTKVQQLKRQARDAGAKA